MVSNGQINRTLLRVSFYKMKQYLSGKTKAILNEMTYKVIAMFCLVMLNPLEAQDPIRKGVTSINMGLSLPLGSFGSQDFNNYDAGYASIGIVTDFKFSYLLNPKIGVVGIWRGQSNFYNSGAYAQGMANYLGAGSPPGSTTVYVESGSYSLGAIMAGVYSPFSMKDRFSVEPHLLLGIAAPTMPSRTTEAYDDGIKLTTFAREQSTAISFAYNLGASFKMDILKSTCLILNLDFYSTRASWTNVRNIGIGHITNKAEIKYFDYYQRIRSLNLSAGLGFKF